jgi:hypothetical protein
MARKAVVDAVETRLAANWAATPIIGLNTLQGEAPSDGSAFVRVEYPVSDTRQITFGSPGNNFWREQGAFRIIINAERGSELDALAWVDTLGDIFIGKQFDGLQTFAPGSPSIDDRNDQGNYYQLSMVIPFQYDFIG